ncbi:MAG: hypothetical protein J7J42_06430 [Thermoplasmata archaeon]|nr:hypothetical protein [Thermoplasmata archaeon]
MKVFHASVYGISHSQLGKILEKKFEEEILPVHLSVYHDFSVLIVEKYEILIKADVVGVMVLRGIDERRIQLEIVVCGIENFMFQKAEKSMTKYLSKILKNIGREKNLEVEIQGEA